MCACGLLLQYWVGKHLNYDEIIEFLMNESEGSDSSTSDSECDDSVSDSDAKPVNFSVPAHAVSGSDKDDGDLSECTDILSPEDPTPLCLPLQYLQGLHICYLLILL
jgi:hypothetical protein